jgi:Putative MetA-pathway of phenol degradation
MGFRISSGRVRGALILAAFNAIACAQSLPAPDSDIVTDRPDVTESSFVVPMGSFQLENGITWTSDHQSQTFDLPESLMRLGLAPRTEFRIAVPNYFGGISGPDAMGFGDTTFGIKEQLGPLPRGFDLSVIFAVSLPLGASGVSSHGYDPFIKLPWSKELGGGWSIGGMQSLFFDTDGGKRNAVWEPALYIEREITNQWQAFAEYAGDFAQRGGPKEIAHFGTAYRLTARQQVDFHFGFGASHSAPSHFFAIGYSLRIDRLWGR